MAEIKRGRTLFFPRPPRVMASAAVVGKKEGEGPLGERFDIVHKDDTLGQPSWEKAESLLQKQAVDAALKKGGLGYKDMDFVFAGDLLNQCIGSSFGIRETEIPFLGLYGACSTMALSAALAACFVARGMADKALAVTSSHFSSAERQFRFPLAYGGQRTPTSQWTVTGAGALIMGKEGGVAARSVTFGKIVDLGVNDINNMGAAMAPAAADIKRN